MAEDKESVGSFFVDLFFEVSKDAKEKVDHELETIKQKLETFARDAFYFNQINEAVERVMGPIERFYEGIVKVAEQAHGLENLSATLGGTVEQVQKLDFAASQTGVGVENMHMGLMFLSRSLGAAAEGSSTHEKAFARLGMSIRGANGQIKSSVEAMPELMEKFAQLPSHAEKARVAMELFGRGGMHLLPLLEKSPGDIAKMSEQFERLGGAFNEETLKASTEFMKNLNTSNFAFQNMRRELATGLLPQLNTFFDMWISWAMNNWPMISEALKTLGNTLGEVFNETLGEGINTLIQLIHDLTEDPERLDLFKKGIEGIGIAMAGVFAYNNPVFAAIIFLTGLFEDLFAMIEGKDSLFGRMSEKLIDFSRSIDDFEKKHPWLMALLHGVKMGIDMSGLGIVSQAVGGYKDALGEVVEDAAFQQHNIRKAHDLHQQDLMNESLDRDNMPLQLGKTILHQHHTRVHAPVTIHAQPGHEEAVGRAVKEHLDKAARDVYHDHGTEGVQ